MEEIAFLLLTLACEIPVAGVLFPKDARNRGMFVLVCANLISHPIGWLLVSWGVNWVAVELGVVAFEMGLLAFFFPMFRKRALGIAIAANLVSAGIGYFFF